MAPKSAAIQLLADAKADLERRRGPGYKYEALVGDRTPPLDFRN